MSVPKKQSFRIATDVGGTCTDTIVLDEHGSVWIGKALSTPPHFAQGVIDSVSVAAASMGLDLKTLFAQTTLFMHGSTVVDNTLLTRDGSKTGLLMTAGFEDTLLMTRGAYGRWSGLPEDKLKHPVKTDRAAPLIEPKAMLGVPERVDCFGDVVTPLDEAVTRAAIKQLLEDEGVEAIAVCLLWSFYNDAHEQMIRSWIHAIAPEVFVSLSSEVAPAPGEYERASTAAINAYAGKVTQNYLLDLHQQLKTRGFGGEMMVMQGYGGLLPIEEAQQRSVGMIECGPAAGVIGSQQLGKQMNDLNIIAADMGGTTFKVGVIQQGQLEYAQEPIVDRFHYLSPKIEVVSIGAGGGSIVSIDSLTRLPKIGPQSAGSDPGPICYGKGGEQVTLTDIMLIIGYMHPDYFLNQSMTLDVAKTEAIFERTIAEPLGMSKEAAAWGIYRVASAQITDLIREITVERGLDPRDFVLHAFGGSCGMLCALFAEDLQVNKIVIPYTASVNCAYGLIGADIVHEFSITKNASIDEPVEAINARFAPMIDKGKQRLLADGVQPESQTMQWAIDFRYRRQVHEVTTLVNAPTPLDEAGFASVVAAFETLYEKKFGKGSAFREAGIEMTRFRLTARGVLNRPESSVFALGDASSDGAIIGRRPIFVDREDAMVDAAIYDFEKLKPGNVVQGPAVIHTPITTIVIQAAQQGTMDTLKNITIERADITEEGATQS